MQVVVAMLEPLLEGGPVTQAAAAVVTSIVQVTGPCVHHCWLLAAA